MLLLIPYILLNLISLILFHINIELFVTVVIIMTMIVILSILIVIFNVYIRNPAQSSHLPLTKAQAAQIQQHVHDGRAQPGPAPVREEHEEYGRIDAVPGQERQESPEAHFGPEVAV